MIHLAIPRTNSSFAFHMLSTEKELFDLMLKAGVDVNFVSNLHGGRTPSLIHYDWIVAHDTTIQALETANFDFSKYMSLRNIDGRTHGCPHPPSSVPELFCRNGYHLIPMEISISKTYCKQANQPNINYVCIIFAIFSKYETNFDVFATA